MFYSENVLFLQIFYVLGLSTLQVDCFSNYFACLSEILWPKGGQSFEKPHSITVHYFNFIQHEIFIHIK